VIAVTLPLGPRGPAMARRLVVAVLGDAGCPLELIDRAVLACSELVTNALLHGHGPPRLRLSARPDRATVSVYDAAPALPEPRAVSEAPVMDPHGRGLVIVGDQADRWGAEPEGKGKWVWAEFWVARRRQMVRDAAHFTPAANPVVAWLAAGTAR
jgi:anti-sigma regulatory factor (Ser/Thr protein kinase)